MSSISKAVGLTLVSLLGSKIVYSQEALPALNIPTNEVTVSGISSGAYMAQQLHTAYSNRFSAAAIIAGGPFYCAENNLSIALTRCMKPDDINKPDVARLQSITTQFAANGDISPIANMQNDRVWVFSSAADSVVLQAASDSLVNYYQAYIKPDNLKYVNNIGGEHSMPTDDFGYPCAYLGKSSNSEDHFINNCGFDAAGQLLAFSYKRIKPPKNTELSGRLIAFDQSSFIANPNSHGLAETGYAYIPQSCETPRGKSGKLPKCKLHLALHGCLQSADRIGTTFVERAGYNDWAERNNIVVLYPQATASLEQGNGNGCWDWWGYDDPNYAKRLGNQMDVVMQMINRLTANDEQAPAPDAPENLSISLPSTGHIQIGWDAQAGVQGYAVYQAKESNGPYFLVSSDLIVEPSFDFQQPIGSTFYYQVVAVGADLGEGKPSKQFAVSVPGIP
ncbi:extracellular catalytic domain type 2 short-chain-length polyhydroxyalkanoate depolymerase [Paraglaciecola aestuariivivens]